MSTTVREKLEFRPIKNKLEPLLPRLLIGAASRRYGACRLDTRQRAGARAECQFRHRWG